MRGKNEAVAGAVPRSFRSIYSDSAAASFLRRQHCPPLRWHCRDTPEWPRADNPPHASNSSSPSSDGSDPRSAGPIGQLKSLAPPGSKSDSSKCCFSHDDSDPHDRLRCKIAPPSSAFSEPLRSSLCHLPLLQFATSGGPRPSRTSSRFVLVPPYGAAAPPVPHVGQPLASMAFSSSQPTSQFNGCVYVHSSLVVPSTIAPSSADFRHLHPPFRPTPRNLVHHRIALRHRIALPLKFGVRSASKVKFMRKMRHQRSGDECDEARAASTVEAKPSRSSFDWQQIQMSLLQSWPPSSSQQGAPL